MENEKGQQEALETKQWENYKNEMEARKIAVKEGTHIISWGKYIKGMFTKTEVYYIKAGSTSNLEIKK